jgi:hypothetical protein
MLPAPEFTIEIAYASLKTQKVLSLIVSAGTTIGEAIQQSGLLLQFPEINWQVNKVGIFSKIVDLDTLLKANDRIEIYHPLLVDPKQARKTRAVRQKSA